MKIEKKVVKKGGLAQTPASSPRPRSTPPARGSAERWLSLALGSDRSLWPRKLKASAFEEQGSKSQAQAQAQAARPTPGKGRGAGDIGLHSGSLELGESRISTN